MTFLGDSFLQGVYPHILYHEIPFFMSRAIPVSLFTCQRQENENATIRRAAKSTCTSGPRTQGDQIMLNRLRIKVMATGTFLLFIIIISIIIIIIMIIIIIITDY
jgi:hypothetical protein